MTDELHSLIGAYVLDALPAEEVEAFREHLSRCATCRAEEAELRAAASRLAERQVVQPRPELRAKVLAAVDRTPQLPPLLPSSDQPLPARRGWWRPTFLVAAAALFAVAMGLMFGLGEGGQTTTLASSVAQVFDASDAQVGQIDAQSAGTLKVAVSPHLGAVAIDTSGLDPLPEDKTYQLWLVTDGQPASAGVIGDLRSGERLTLPTSGVLLAVTVEPHGGSPQPTTEPIAVFDPGAVASG